MSIPSARAAFLLAVIGLVMATAAEAATEPSAEPSPEHPAPIVQVVGDGVLKLLEDGAGHGLFDSDTTVVFVAEGAAILCCQPGRQAGQEVEQVFRFGIPGAIAAVSEDMNTSYPVEMTVDGNGQLWLDGYRLVEGAWTDPLPGLGYGARYVPQADGTVWAALGDLARLTVAGATDGEWTRHVEQRGFPRLSGEGSGTVSDIRTTLDGSVWVGVGGGDRAHPGGLARFDGRKWHVEQPLGKGRKASVEALAVAPDGSLWAYLAASRSKAFLAHLDGRIWTVVDTADGVPATAHGDGYLRVRMEVGADGVVWLSPLKGSECAQLFSWDGSTWFQHLENACVKRFTIAPDGAAWVSAELPGLVNAVGGEGGLYVLPPADVSDDYLGATVVESPGTEEEAMLATARLACRVKAPHADARAMCELVAPLLVDAFEAAVDFCGGEEPESEGAAMCLALLTPVLADSLAPPPWREGMDADVAAAYLDASAAFEPPADELAHIDRLPAVDRAAAWAAAAERDAAFAEALGDLELPAASAVLAADTAERLRELAAAERSLADDPTGASVSGDYLLALAAARAAEGDLRWYLGLPPRVSSALEAWGEGMVELPDGPPVEHRPAPVMVEGRTGHAATKLVDGRVLLTGGYEADTPSQRRLDTAEVFDPVTGSFSEAGRLKTRRSSHVAVPLPDGRVLLIGGRWTDRPDTGADLFDPDSGSAERLQGPPGAYDIGVVSALGDGRVLVVGSTVATASAAWVYEPTAGSFGAVGAGVEPRKEGTATLLEDGTVLLVGGQGDYFTDEAEDAELFDPADGTFESIGRPIHARSGHTATRLLDGRVLLAGGASGLADLSSAELYDPVTNTFTPAGSLRRARYDHQATLLDDGRVLITGGTSFGGVEGLRSLEVFDPATGRFTHAGWLAEAREGATATLLDDGRVLIAGGGVDAATAEIYDPVSGTSTPLGS